MLLSLALVPGHRAHGGHSLRQVRQGNQLRDPMIRRIAGDASGTVELVQGLPHRLELLNHLLMIGFIGS